MARLSLEQFVSEFWSRVRADERTGCLLWTGSASKGGKWGYGQCWNGGISTTAHRVAWILTFGSIAEGLYVCHRCDVPLCVNPAHLFLGTPSDNTVDAVRKGRIVSPGLRGESHGCARLTEEQVREIRSAPRVHGSLTAFARRLGVSLATISHARSGRNWRYLGGAA